MRHIVIFQLHLVKLGGYGFGFEQTTWKHVHKRWQFNDNQIDENPTCFGRTCGHGWRRAAAAGARGAGCGAPRASRRWASRCGQWSTEASGRRRRRRPNRCSVLSDCSKKPGLVFRLSKLQRSWNLNKRANSKFHCSSANSCISFIIIQWAFFPQHLIMPGAEEKQEVSHRQCIFCSTSLKKEGIDMNAEV